MRFAEAADDPEGLSDLVQHHLDARAFWLEPAAYGTGLVSEILEVLRHPATVRRDVGLRAGRTRRHYLGTGRTPEGHLLHIGFHFEKTGATAVDSMRHAGFGSRLLVDSAWCEAEPRRQGALPGWPTAAVGPSRRLAT